ncbi:hypothetical protein H5410_049431 [Solanum commersonii]|uniref:Uncharacterized protein n=1 Tax=Solanum commersonii TaxID=4109 RepID=A0A9J5WUM0_SOLCO|nr:hypothetical protein H5410_049431 [Solanum commersonii]
MEHATLHLENAEKGLLHFDNNLIDFIVTRNPKDLWKNYENSMSKILKTISNVTKNYIQQLVLNHINELLLSMGRNINEFKMYLEMLTFLKQLMRLKKYISREI